MKGATMPRQEVEQWASAVIAVSDTLSPDRLVRRGEVADMCGVNPAGADRIIEWARMVRHRGEPLPFITMPGVVRAMKEHRARVRDDVEAATEARIEWERKVRDDQKAKFIAQQRAASARAKKAKDLAAARAVARADARDMLDSRDYTMPKYLASLMQVDPSCPTVYDIPAPKAQGSTYKSRSGFNGVLRVLAGFQFTPTSDRDLCRFAKVRPSTIGFMVHRGLIWSTVGGYYAMTVAGFVLHTIANGPDAWARPCTAQVAWQTVLRRIGEGSRRMDIIVDVNRPDLAPRYQQQMTRAGLIRVEGGDVYLTAHGWQWARMDLSVQG